MADERNPDLERIDQGIREIRETLFGGVPGKEGAFWQLTHKVEAVADDVREVREFVNTTTNRLNGQVRGLESAIDPLDDRVNEIEKICPVLKGDTCASTDRRAQVPGKGFMAGVLLSGGLMLGILWHVGRWVAEKGAEWLAVLHPTAVK